MLREGKPAEEPAELTTPAPKRGIKSESFQRWFRGSKAARAGGAPLPVYHASPATADLRPKSYGTAGEHSYFYFAVSKAWARNFAREEGGADVQLGRPDRRMQTVRLDRRISRSRRIEPGIYRRSEKMAAALLTPSKTFTANC
jgi:hypothetical protein